MTQLELEKKSKNGREKKRLNWSSLLWCYFMSLAFMFLGFAWLSDIKTKGYYVDGKHQITIMGEDGLITVYVLIIAGFCMLVYSIYSTLNGKFKNN